MIPVFMETAICHNIVLHLLGASLDGYIRLCKPHLYTHSLDRHATTYLKLGAPWVVSVLQTSAQTLLGDPLPPSRLEKNRFCSCPDVNFLILRTSVGFLLPLVVSAALLFATAHKIKARLDGEVFDQPDPEELSDALLGSKKDNYQKFGDSSAVGSKPPCQYVRLEHL